ncbi:nuclear transport factor 2 family protein [Vibrio tubiashii]|uniref:nuclear transport factor 2 family protein n=1 Tax=Vibrio tubiashii TaxID=29498 RepID=UPI00234F37B7|nr:nuclear transport factor 2 family protein [Vibrio tubiashii]WCP68986.1 nuclear transport factor 2 family protein [Vibrio tubiashii]
MTTRELQDFAVMFFAAVDAQNATALKQYFSEEITLQMANLPITEGGESVIAAFKAADERFSSIKHSIEGIWIGDWEQGPVVSVEAIAQYEFPDGRTLELPVTSTLRLTQNKKVANYKIFMDPLPAFS